MSVVITLAGIKRREARHVRVRNVVSLDIQDDAYTDGTAALVVFHKARGGYVHKHFRFKDVIAIDVKMPVSSGF